MDIGLHLVDAAAGSAPGSFGSPRRRQSKVNTQVSGAQTPIRLLAIADTDSYLKWSSATLATLPRVGSGPRWSSRTR